MAAMDRFEALNPLSGERSAVEQLNAVRSASPAEEFAS